MTHGDPAARVQILCIDDDPDVLAGLQLSLRGFGEISVAADGESGLRLAAELPDLAVVLCDMRMPGLAGDEVLARFRQQRPLVTRLLLTGYSDMNAAIRAINQGRLFRFLNKPCPREVLHQAVSDALAMASPASYGQAERLASLIRQVGAHCRHEAGWAATMAAMLANLGLVGLRPSLQEKVLLGLALDAVESGEVERGHRRAMALLERIPRIRPVRQLLCLIEPALADGAPLSAGEREWLMPQARLIRLVRDYVRMEAAGLTAQQALARLHDEQPAQTDLISALRSVLGPQADLDRLLELSPDMLRAGMVLARAVYTARGQLLAPAGYQINDSFAERLLDACPELRHGRIAVIIPAQISGHLHHQLLTQAPDGS